MTRRGRRSDVGRLKPGPTTVDARLARFEGRRVARSAPGSSPRLTTSPRSTTTRRTPGACSSHSAAERDRAQRGVAAEFPDLSLAPIDVPDEDWAARSQASLRAIQVGHLVVAPPWDVPAPGSGIRDPGSAEDVGAGFSRPINDRHPAFDGLRHRPSRDDAAVPGRAAADSICATGRSSTSAPARACWRSPRSRLGASPVVAIDDDPDAIQAAGENVRAERGAIVDVRVADLRTAALPTVRRRPRQT